MVTLVTITLCMLCTCLFEFGRKEERRVVVKPQWNTGKKEKIFEVHQAFHPLHLQIKLPALLLRLRAPSGSLSAAMGVLSGSENLIYQHF